MCRKRILWRNRRPIQYGFGDGTKDFEYILKCPSIIYKSYYWLKLSCEVIPRFLLESSLRRDLRAWSIITGAKTCKTEKKKKKRERLKEKREREKKVDRSWFVITHIFIHGLTIVSFKHDRLSYFKKKHTHKRSKSSNEIVKLRVFTVYNVHIVALRLPDSLSNWNLRELFIFGERGKPDYPETNRSEQKREPTTNSTQI